LTETEQAAIDAHSLFDLSTFLPKKPGDVELKVIKEMFEASVDGQPYDTERWGQYFRPAGVNAPGSAAATNDDAEAAPAVRTVPAAKPAASSPAWEDDAAEAAASLVTKPAGGNQKAEDILAMIRARQAK
jgi:hypothetical protein